MPLFREKIEREIKNFLQKKHLQMETILQMELQLALLVLAATGVLTQDEDPAAGGEE